MSFKPVPIDKALSDLNSEKVKSAIIALHSTKLPSEINSVSISICELAKELDDKLLINNQEKVMVFVKLRELKHTILDALKVAIFFLFLCPSSLFAQSLMIAGDEEVPAYRIVKLKAIGIEEKAGSLWKIVPSKNLSNPVNTPPDMYEFVAPPGVYEISLLSIKLKPDGSTSLKEATKTVIIREPSPGPKPVPPDPGPTPPKPVPPEPVPPAPIPAEGFRVLMVYERADLPKMPAKQVDILHSQQVADYLNKTCVLGPDGKMPEWRVWDQHAEPTTYPKLWQDVIKRERKSIPWIVISTGKTGYEGPLPATIEETLTLLRSYGSK